MNLDISFTVNKILNMKDNAIIPRAKVIQYLGYVPLLHASEAEHMQNQLNIFSDVEAVKHILLTDHNVYLDMHLGEGYVKVKSGKQAEVAREKCKRQLKRRCEKFIEVIVCTNAESLTDKEKKYRQKTLDDIGYVRNIIEEKL